MQHFTSILLHSRANLEDSKLRTQKLAIDVTNYRYWFHHMYVMLQISEYKDVQKNYSFIDANLISDCNIFDENANKDGIKTSLHAFNKQKLIEIKSLHDRIK